MVEAINVVFDDADLAKLRRVKDELKLNWVQFIMLLANRKLITFLKVQKGFPKPLEED